MKIDLKELKKDQKANAKARLEFVRMYAKWIRKTPNKVWSKTLAKFHDGQI
ncbi:hypothetical protein HY989_02965 [Candidatus Micrarchaeota archaeon]|nr:hypothetical protein [Candidatus Micrarchaeota archaeon]